MFRFLKKRPTEGPIQEDTNEVQIVQKELPENQKML